MTREIPPTRGAVGLRSLLGQARCHTCETRWTTRLSFGVDEAKAAEVQRCAHRLGVDRSELLREALRRSSDGVTMERPARSPMHRSRLCVTEGPRRPRFDEGNTSADGFPSGSPARAASEGLRLVGGEGSAVALVRGLRAPQGHRQGCARWGTRRRWPHHRGHGDRRRARLPERAPGACRAHRPAGGARLGILAHSATFPLDPPAAQRRLLRHYPGDIGRRDRRALGRETPGFVPGRVHAEPSRRCALSGAQRIEKAPRRHHREPRALQGREVRVTRHEHVRTD